MVARAPVVQQGGMPITAPFAWHLFLLRLAHRRQGDAQHPQDRGQDTSAPLAMWRRISPPRPRRRSGHYWAGR
jgi:hypothetical protein